MATHVHIRRMPVLAVRVRDAIARLDVPRPADLSGLSTIDVRADGCASIVIHTTVIDDGLLARLRWIRDRNRHYRWASEVCDAICRDLDERPVAHAIEGASARLAA